MKIKITTILLVLFFSNKLISQRVELMLVPFEQNGKWGYLDINDSVIVEPIYEEAYPTFESRGRILINGKYGYINGKGEIVIKPKFDEAEDFKYGIAKVEKRGREFFIKVSGEKNTSTIALCGGHYRQCLQSRNLRGLDTVRLGEKYMVKITRAVRENGKLQYYPDTLQNRFDTIISIGRGYVLLEKDHKIALMNDSRRYPSAEYIDTSLNFIYDEIEFFPCQENLLEPYEIFGFKRDDKWGYIKLFYDAEEIIKPKYYSINSLERGYALVEYKRGKFGYINYYGKEYFKAED